MSPLTWVAGLVVSALVAQAARAPTVVGVTAGADHACALTRRGQAYCWGANEFGQLGRGRADSTPGTAAELVVGGLRFTTIAAGYSHTCGIAVTGAAYCWGSNEYGQLGDGSRRSSARPVAVAGGLEFRSIAPGGTHTCAVTRGDVAYCWGGNWHGQLGQGSLSGDSATPCCLRSPVRVHGQLGYRTIAAGGIHTCAIALDGRGYCWGSPQDGRLGSGAADALNDSVDKPVPAPVVGAVRFANVATRSWHTCAIATNADAYCWGRSTAHDTADIRAAAEPRRVAGVTGLRAIAAGLRHNCALTRGAAYCWGANADGQLGNGTTRASSAPVRVATGRRFTSITAGGKLEASGGSIRTWSFSCAVATASRGVYCWGANHRGQLGDGSTTPSTLPVRVRALPPS